MNTINKTSGCNNNTIKIMPKMRLNKRTRDYFQLFLESCSCWTQRTVKESKKKYSAKTMRKTRLHQTVGLVITFLCNNLASLIPYRIHCNRANCPPRNCWILREYFVDDIYWPFHFSEQTNSTLQFRRQNHFLSWTVSRLAISNW